MDRETPYSDALTHFQGQTLVTVGCGTTCACLGDERNLREFLVADETARRLRAAGHSVISLLVDDSLDPLNHRQLRVAFNKDEQQIEKWAEWCGKPLSHIPDPWDCHSSYAAHFEDALLGRLQTLGCTPNLISTTSLYDGGLYAPYVQQVLLRYDEIMSYLSQRFSGYSPETLFWMICPECGYIDETKIEGVSNSEVKYYCRRCEKSGSIPLSEVKGKLNWKLDCAVRWVLLNIDAEPFNKSYLEPQAGSFVVAQEISKKFFGGHTVQPLRYGLVKMDSSLSYRLLSSFPPEALRQMFTDHATADLKITPEYMLNLASRHQTNYGLSYLECIKQLVPMWLLRPQALTEYQREIVSRGISFAEEFLDQKLALHLPTREIVDDIPTDTLGVMHDFLVDMLRLRNISRGSWEAFKEPAKNIIASLGDSKHAVISCLRGMIGQKQGVPAPRLLYLLPEAYLESLEYVLDLRLSSTSDIIQLPQRLAA